MVLATSRNLSEGLRLVTISTRRNSIYPPSRAGMGIMFINASMMDRNAVICQKAYQLHDAGNMSPSVPNPPRLWAPSLVNISFSDDTYVARRSVPICQPRGIACSMLYSMRVRSKISTGESICMPILPPSLTATGITSDESPRSTRTGTVEPLCACSDGMNSPIDGTVSEPTATIRSRGSIPALAAASPGTTLAT